MSVEQISVTEVFELSKENQEIMIVDVREPDEHQALRCTIGHHLLPMSRFDAGELAEAKNIAKDTKVYFLCRSGNRSMNAAQMMLVEGFPNVFNIAGGMIAWEEAGLPVAKG